MKISEDFTTVGETLKFMILSQMRVCSFFHFLYNLKNQLCTCSKISTLTVCLV
jgi:hypothetical protein